MGIKKIVVISLLIGIFGFGIYYFSSSQLRPKEAALDIPEGMTRYDIAELIGRELWWNEKEKNAFAFAYAQVSWDAFNAEALSIFSEEFDWNEAEEEVFLTQSTKYFEPEYDFLSRVYAPGSYVVPGTSSPAQIAEIFIERFKSEAEENLESAVKNHISEEDRLKIRDLVRSEVDLLPDLVPLPASDLQIKKENGNTYLLFSTIYFNQGNGPLELRIDESLAHTRRDINRDVFQRIYQVDGGYRDRPSGNFLWHQEHLHYHFADFVTYDLEAVDAPAIEELSGARQKSTFCVRDVSNVELELPNRDSDARYKICGRKLQGISVGWADTYFYTYPDQRLNVTGLASGVYKLSFVVNPDDRFDELSLENNISSVLFRMNPDAGTLEILEETPKEYPVVEHVYEEQVFE